MKDQLNLRGKWQNGSPSNITQNREFSMDWVDRPENYKGLYGILQLLQGSHLHNFPLQTVKLDWVAFHSLTFQLKCLGCQSNQYKKLVPVLTRFCNIWSIPL